MLRINIIIRNLLKRRLSTTFAIVSFTIAFCCSILVYLYVTDELAFDKYNDNFKQTYRLNLKPIDGSLVNCSFPGVYNDNLLSVSGVKKFTRLIISSAESNISINNEPFIETNLMFGDQSVFDIFDFEFIAGNSSSALTAPLSIIITESMVAKYFDQTNVMGKTIHYDNHDFTITGIVKDIPNQSHFSMNFMASVSSYKLINNDLLTKWYMTAFNYYFLLPANSNIKDVENQLTDIFAEGHGIADKDRNFEMYLEPLSDIHLKSIGTRWDNAQKGDYKVVIGLIVTGLLILLIAIANYINNLTAEYRKKIKQSGIRRINGASRIVLAIEQGFETLFLLTTSLLLALFLTFATLPYLNVLVEKSLKLNPSILLFLSTLLILSTFISSLYPILFFSSFDPSNAIKNQFALLNRKGKRQQQVIRASFVTIQLSIATILIIASFVINNQLQLVLSSKTGFDKENTIIVKNPYGQNMNQRYELFKAELLKMPMVKIVGVAQNAPGGYINNYSPARLPDQEKKESQNIAQIALDHDFLKAIGARFLDGRNFDKNFTSDKNNKIVVNQSAVNLFNLESPVGTKLAGINNAFTPNDELEIIGVIEDMQYFTLKESAKPVMYYIRDWGCHNIVARLNEGDYSSTIANIKSTWKKLAPEYPFNMQFMDERITSNYKSEINTAKIITALTAIALMLSSLGISGMIVYTIQHRTKEIGIRKVNGARISEILTMLNKDFVKWVAIAFVIATPLAYYAMNKWLENFAYKTELSWWIFALAGVLALGIALLTVSLQSWKAATKNPVESLRYE